MVLRVLGVDVRRDTQIRVPFRRGGDDEEWRLRGWRELAGSPIPLAVSDARAMDAIADALVRSFVADETWTMISKSTARGSSTVCGF